MTSSRRELAAAVVIVLGVVGIAAAGAAFGALRALVRKVVRR